MDNPPIKPTVPPATDNRHVWLRIGTLIDGTSLGPLRNAHVVYNREEILFVGENSPPEFFLNLNQRQPDLDLPEWTLLPGLIEAHAHLFLNGDELNPEKRAAHLKQAPEELLKRARACLDKLVRLGIIAVRDAGDKNGVGLAVAKLYRTNAPKSSAGVSPAGSDPEQAGTPALQRPLMPYVDSPGAAIHRQGRYGSFMADPIENCSSLKECVEARVKAGADRIKLIVTGSINFEKGAVTAKPQMTAAEVREIVQAAKSFGKQTFAHASGADGIENAIEGGVDSIEHGFFIRDDQLAKMYDRQIAWVPTFAPVQKQLDYADRLGWNSSVVTNLKKILEQHTISLVKAYQMGVPIIAGSDAGAFGVGHGYGLVDELELMGRAGLSPLAVINSATGTSSGRLGFKEKFGQIKTGFQSRFILTRHSPLENIPNLRKEKIVIFDGEVF
jgi:imidazolonepropionase-like amidohydrolase